MYKLPIFISLMLVSMVVVSQDTVELSIDETITDKTKIDRAVESATQWGVTKEEWTRFEYIMSTKGKYFWRDLDPIMVLGINAKTVTERKRFAKILAKQEYQNTHNLILLEREYQLAFDELYGDIPIIDVSLLKPKDSPVAASLVERARGKVGDRYIVFVSTRSAESIGLIRELMGDVEFGVSIDIHFKNDTRADIKAWAKKAKISTQKVKVGSITLNPFSGLYEQYKPEVPSLYFYEHRLKQVSQVRQ